MKKVLTIIVVALLLVSLLLMGGCGGGKVKMLTGRWKLESVGSGNGGNQQAYPLPVVVDIYPNGTIDLLESPFGKWTMDRDTFTFKSDDGSVDMSGGFRIDFVEDQQTGGSVPTLTVLPDTQDASYILKKISDLGPLESAKRAKTAAPAVRTATPTATPEATAASN